MEILVVDDSPANIFFVRAILKNKENINLSEATNGEAAVNMCRNNNFDLIFMDITMPIKDGFQATKEIREFDSFVKIVAVTGNYGMEDYESHGFDYYLAKPVSKDKIYDYIQSLEN